MAECQQWLNLRGGHTFIVLFTQLFCMFKIVHHRMLGKNNLAPPLLTLPELFSQGRRWGVKQKGVDLLFVKPMVMIAFLV